MSKEMDEINDKIIANQKLIIDKQQNHIDYLNGKMKKKLIEMNDELFKEIVKSAQKNDRSVNKEISSLIKKGLKK